MSLPYRGGFPLQTNNAELDLQNATTPIAGVWTNDTALSLNVDVRIALGDGTKNLHTDAGVLTLTLDIGGNTAVTARSKLSGQTRALLEANGVRVPAGATLTVKVASDNANDVDVDTTVEFSEDGTHLPAGTVLCSVVADGSNSATTFKTDLAHAVNDALNGRRGVVVSTGTLQDQGFVISDYDGTTKFLSTGAGELTGAPTAGDNIKIV